MAPTQAQSSKSLLSIIISRTIDHVVASYRLLQPSVHATLKTLTPFEDRIVRGIQRSAFNSRIAEVQRAVPTLLDQPMRALAPGRFVDAHLLFRGDTLPVYVWDKYEEFRQAVPMVDLPDNEIEAYLKRNTDVVGRIVHENDITVMQANHVVLMSVVAQRVSEQTSEHARRVGG